VLLGVVVAAQIFGNSTIAVLAMSHRHSIAITLDDMRYQVAYLDWGTGPVLLCLHGFMGNKANWLAVMKRLASKYRCVSLDLLGFGETYLLHSSGSCLPVALPSIATEAACVRAVARALCLEPCAIAGHSFGGWVAATYAWQYPEAVTACILVAPVGMHGDGFSNRPRPSRSSPVRAPATDSRYGDRTQWEAEKLDAVVGEVRAPTLVIAAEHDAVVPLSCPQAYAANIPNARLQVIPGAGHALPLEGAAATAAAIAAFLA